MKLSLLFPGGREPSQNFADGAGPLRDDARPPRGAQAYAAATGGAYHRKDQEIPAEQKEVLLLLGDNLKQARQAMVELRAAKKTVALGWQNPNPEAVAGFLEKPANFRLFLEISQRADGAIAATPDLVSFFTGAGIRHVEYIPTPAPIDEPRWDVAVAVEEHRGIFVGTRDFQTPARNHLAALLAVRPLAESMYETVTVLNYEGGRGREMIERAGFDPRLVKVVEKRLTYADYLYLLARHKLVWQLDRSGGVGQVAMDALLARIPCIGGLNVTERLVFPELSGHGRDVDQLFDLTARLLEHPHDCEAVVHRAVELGREKLSYAAAARAIEGFYGRIRRS